MKIQVLQENLGRAVSITSRFASSKAQLPVLSNIHLKTQKNKLVVNATNLELSASVSIGAQIQEEGEITVPARVISEIVGNLSKHPVNLEADKEILKISTENFSSQIPGMNSGDFPVVPSTVDKTSVSLKTKDFLLALEKILFSVSVDESRPAITGALFIQQKGFLELVGTDGFRLSKKKIEVDNLSEGRVIIPKAILGELIRLSKTSEEILFSFMQNQSQVVFGFENIILSSRVISADYPPFEKIIPTTSSYKVNVGKDDFLQAVKLSSVFARDAGNVIKLDFKSKKGFEISAESKNTGSQKSFVEAAINGELGDSKIAFNYRFLEEFLNSLGTDSTEMLILGANSPCVFRDPKDKDYLHLIMPIKIEE